MSYRNDDSNNLVVKNLTEIKKYECVLIGDSKYDSIGAEQVGVDFIAVTYGFGFKTKKEVNMYSNIGVASNVEDLLTIILEGKDK